MRRSGIALLLTLALVALATPAVAQPKVTITGFIDQISSWTNNLSATDLNLARKTDSEWYARTRVRPDIIAEVGTTKFVLGIEIDLGYGQTGTTDGSSNVNPGGGPQRFGSNGGFDLNTDVAGVMEIKWAYTEFDIPMIPVPTRVRVGAQPWAALYKGGIFATGDFGGFHKTTQWSSMVRSHFSYAQIEESSTGVRDGFPRGDDFAIVASVEITPFKGLDIRPIYSYANFEGITSASSRQNRGGVGNNAAFFPGPSGVGGATQESRHTLGVDARWRFGPFYIDPTVLYQFGGRDQVCPAAAAAFCVPGGRDYIERSAWYFDVRGGWQAGPLLLEGAVVYTTGNKADERFDLAQDDLNYFEPISTDNSFFAVWSEMQSSGIDYHNRIRANAGSLNPGVAIGYDKYGIIVVGARASYALTPAFTFRGGVHARWTAEEVDTASTVTAGAGLTPRCAALAVANGTCADRGTARFYGTEANLGFQWRFAPNVVFDMVGSYFWAGNVLSSPAITNTATGLVTNGRNPGNAQAISARVRFSY